MSDRRFPTLAICGPGRCGKDTAGDWLRDNTFLRFDGGCSWVARHYMAERLAKDYGVERLDPDAVYDKRHEDRKKWYDYLNEWRANDPARLVRMVLEDSDFVCGIRDRAEFEAARREGLIDLAVWVERPCVGRDPTLTYEHYDCDVVIYNDSDLETYLGRWKRLASALGVLR